jgi:putative nucleotidyltransferase-like protein
VRERGFEGSFWPSEQQKLLLRTAFAGGDESAKAWAHLRPQLDLDALELGSFPLLPLVHRQLERLAIEDPYMPRLAGIRRRTWYLNQLQLDALAPALHALENAGTAPVVIGGWQFLAHYYEGDFGARPVEELEVLVRPRDASASAHALAEVGFEGPRDVVAGVSRFIRPDGHTCRVHERLAREFSVPQRGIEVEDLWDDTFEISLGDTRARALAPTNELVRVCLAGARASAAPNALWIADALAVLHTDSTAIDWERLVRQARRLRATLRLRDALAYLRRQLGARVPDDAIRKLEATPAKRRERLAHKEAGRSRRLVGPSPRTATRFLHVTSDRPLPVALVTLPAFLRDELGLERRAQVPLEVVRRVAARRTRGASRLRPPTRSAGGRTIRVG